MKLFKDYAVLASGQIVGRLLGFLAFAWLARALDPEAYGAVEYVIGLSVLITALVDGGTGVVGVRRSAQDPAGLPVLAFQILTARLALVALGVPAGLVWLFALSLVAAPWRQEWLFQATDRMRNVAVGQVIRAAVFATLVWALGSLTVPVMVRVTLPFAARLGIVHTPPT